MDAGVTILSDEVYEHIIYDAVHASAATFGEDVITVNAASKTYAMTGWRLGFIAGPTEYMEQCLKVHQCCRPVQPQSASMQGLRSYTGISPV